MATYISEHASVHADANIGHDVHIGPYSVVGSEATIGDGCRLENSVTLLGRVSLGANNRIYPYTVIGAPPQDLTYRGEPTEVRIGSNNIIRESVTINQATCKEARITAIGDDCYLMAGCHIAHDCQLRDGIVVANAVLLGGHVHIDSHANLSGGLAVHHYASIGAHAFVTGLSRVIHDAPPYMVVDGSPARPRCVNIVGLKRNEFSPSVIRALSEAHRLLYRQQAPLDDVRETLRTENQLYPAVNHLLNFIQLNEEGCHGRSRAKRRAG